jgi:hypothetical protein
MSDNEPAVLRDQPVVDLSHLTSAEEMAAIARIEDVAVVVVPESLAAAYAAIPVSDVAATVYVPAAAKVRVHTGTLMVGGDGVGATDDVLVVIGMLLITSPVTGPVPQHIYVIGSVLAPRGSEQILGPVLSGGTGSVAYYRYADGQDIKVLSGQVKLSAAMLANTAGQPDDILIVAGQVVVSGEITTVGYRQVVAAGQLVGPAVSRDVIEPRLEAQGQVAWYPGAEARVFHDDDTHLGPEFFRLLEHPVNVVAFGGLTLDAGVTEEALRDKVDGLIVFGRAVAPKELVGVVQVLATDLFGGIQAADELRS